MMDLIGSDVRSKRDGERKEEFRKWAWITLEH